MTHSRQSLVLDCRLVGSLGQICMGWQEIMVVLIGRGLDTFSEVFFIAACPEASNYTCHRIWVASCCGESSFSLIRHG